MSIECMTAFRRYAALVFASLLLGFGQPDASVAASFAHRAAEPAGAQGGSKKSGGPLIDHGGTVLTASATHAIYWGTAADFPSDLQTGMASLLRGLSRSSYLGIATQYMRGATPSTTYAGAVSDP